jgi:hypothetical protein
MVRGEDRHGRFGILLSDPVSREQDPGGGTSIRWLNQDTQRLSASERFAKVPGMTAERDDGCGDGRNSECHTVERLAKE